MKRRPVIEAVAAVGIGLLLGAGLYVQNRTNQRLTADLEQARHAIAASHRTLETSSGLSKQLEEKVGRLTEVLDQSTERLAESDARLKQYEARFGPVVEAQRKPLSAEETKRLRAAVPAPQVDETKDRSGKVLRRIVFPQLIGKGGEVLATNAEFGTIYGRRLVFRRTAGTPLAFDVEELHPGVLAHLEIDPTEAMYQQRELDRQKQQREAAAYKDYLARQAAEQKLIAATRQAQAEQARAEEARQKQQAEIDLKYRQMENDRLRAEAQLRAADAAMTRAINSAPYYYQTPYYGPVYPLPPGSPPSQPSQPTPPTGSTTPNPGQRGYFLPTTPMLPRSPFLTNSVAR